MNRQSTQKLRLDRRLSGRRDWISSAELESALEALPDVSHKKTTLGEVEEESASPRAQAPSTEPSVASAEDRLSSE